MPTQCFMMEPTTHAVRYLRRFVSGSQCSASGSSYHDAMILLDRVAIVELPGGSYEIPGAADEWPADDPRWPTTCACGYEFTEADRKQLFSQRLWRRADTGEEMSLWDAPAGAMWYADWFNEMSWVGPDGRSLVVRLPGGGEWGIDQPSSGGGQGWTREGVPPNVTARPSIKAGGSHPYHGFLTDGVLTDDVDGNTH